MRSSRRWTKPRRSPGISIGSRSRRSVGSHPSSSATGSTRTSSGGSWSWWPASPIACGGRDSMDRGAQAMSEPERPLRLDATREEALEHAAKLVAEAWRSFDRFRPEEPALDERVRELIRGALPEEPVPVHEALDDAARILDESIAQPRPRYFAFIGSSGLEIGTIGDLLSHTYDINLAVDARAATQLENQAVAWVGEFVGFTAANGAFTSGGTVSNMTALAAA